MTTPTRPDCFEFAMSFIGDPEEAELRSYIEALEARAALAQPEPASQALADLVWPDPTTITPCGMAINGRMYRLTPMDEPETRADGEVAELVTLIRQIALAWEPDACLLGNMTAGQLARAADMLERLAQPEPVGPTDKELLGCMLKAAASVPGGQCTGILDWDKEAIAAARAVLARWGRPTITPIPVSERLPGAEDCDAEGRCYIWDWLSCDWKAIEALDKPLDGWSPTWWLPFHALPLPRQPAPDAPAP